MTIAAQILRANHTAGQVRKAAQTQCRSMTRDHVKNKDRYWFGDGSALTVSRNTPTLGAY